MTAVAAINLQDMRANCRRSWPTNCSTWNELPSPSLRSGYSAASSGKWGRRTSSPRRSTCL